MENIKISTCFKSSELIVQVSVRNWERDIFGVVKVLQLNLMEDEEEGKG